MKFIIPTILGALTVALAMPSTPATDNVLSRRDLECNICKRVTSLVVEDLPESATEDEVIAGLEGVCSKFPKRDKTKCDTFVEQYANELVHILVEERDPALACALLGTC